VQVVGRSCAVCGARITASGCGRTINYLRVCGDITRSECLEQIDIPLGR
jgi:hypothetical protein